MDGVQWSIFLKKTIDHNLNNCCYYREIWHLFRNCLYVGVQLQQMLIKEFFVEQDKIAMPQQEVGFQLATSTFYLRNIVLDVALITLPLMGNIMSMEYQIDALLMLSILWTMWETPSCTMLQVHMSWVTLARTTTILIRPLYYQVPY